MATNHLLPFANGQLANVVSDERWADYAQRESGFQSGVAKSEFCNRAFAQGANAGFAVGQLAADYAEQDATINAEQLYAGMKTGIIELVRRELVPQIMLEAHPVGSIYESTKATSPADLFGGVWEALTDGRVLVAAGDQFAAGSLGGELSHKLTTDEMPSHNHSATVSASGSHSHSFSATTSWSGDHSHTRGTMNITGDIGADDRAASIASGAFWAQHQTYSNTSAEGGDRSGWMMFHFDASRNWTGSTSSNGGHNHSLSGNTASSGSHSHSVTVGSNGAGVAVSLVQPYMAVYRWIRTA